MSAGRPAMAVVVVTYESAAELPATLAAVSEQLEEGDELVICDNGSADGSAAAARAAAPAARVIELGANHGFAGGCAAGAEATSAPLLLFLNPDARPEPGALAALRTAAGERPRWGAWQALVLLEVGDLVNSAGGRVHWTGLAWPEGTDSPASTAGQEPRETSFASGAALVVRRDAWEQSGGFDPAYFMYGEDVDLSLRLRLAGWGIGVVPRARVRHSYEFAKGAYKWFHLERNRWWTVIGAYPLPLLALVTPALIGLEVALLAVAALGGWLPAKLAAQREVAGSLGWAWQRRRRIQRGRRVSSAIFAAALSEQLDSPYLGRVATSAAPARVQAAYWRAVRALLGA